MQLIVYPIEIQIVIKIILNHVTCRKMVDFQGVLEASFLP